MSDKLTSVNISNCLQRVATKNHAKIAVHVPAGKGPNGKTEYNSFTFGELNRKVDQYAHGLSKSGVIKGTRVLFWVQPGFDFIAITFALFKAGAIPVLIDPGMGKANLLNCVKQSEPEVMIAIGKAIFAKMLYPKYFRSVKRTITIGESWFWTGRNTQKLWIDTDEPFKTVETFSGDTASIIFTTGSTGPPKGVVYTHGVFEAQLKLIGDHYGVDENDVDLPAFPLFALFSTALGMAVVIPELDPTRPAQLDPQKFVEAINEQKVTFTFGSPAIWRKVSRWCVEKNVTLPSLKKVLMAGAPVADEIHERLLGGVLPVGAQTYTPFGATEGLPVCDITGREALNETSVRTKRGEGVCVGYPLPGATVEIIEINDGPINQWRDAVQLPDGEMGEIVSSGPMVTKEYYNLPEQNRLHKIYDRDSPVVRHRMGDIGYIDDKGRLWFCGRKSHRVITTFGTMFTVPCEAIINNHPGVFRSALVGPGKAPDQRPVMIVERTMTGRKQKKKELTEELLALAGSNELTKNIKTILFHKKFPTDIRHNAKIFREKLREWARGKL